MGSARMMFVIATLAIKGLTALRWCRASRIAPSMACVSLGGVTAILVG